MQSPRPRPKDNFKPDVEKIKRKGVVWIFLVEDT
jgi:hypothetical protein